MQSDTEPDGGQVRHVHDFVTGLTLFYVRDNVAYDMGTDRIRFRIARNYWFEVPSHSGQPSLIDHDGLIYAYPPTGPPQFYCERRRARA